MSAVPALTRRRLERPAEPPLRLMIVDDSQVARAVLSRMVEAHDEFEIVALAGTAEEALAALKNVRVDAILLDVEMPGVSGLEALPEIIRAGAGARVLIISSMAEAGAETTVRALALGAADALPKPGIGNFAGRFAEILAERLRRIGRADHDAPPKARPPGAPIALRPLPEGALGCVALGASTGGLSALFEFLRALPQRIEAPILVTQHLPSLFMPYFARQLESASGRVARVAIDGEALRANQIHVAPGEAHLCVVRDGEGTTRVRLDTGRAPSGCRPSVDPMLASVASAYGPAGLGVTLSGMGRDGLSGAKRLVECGGAMLVQDRGSAAIWGMPRVVAEAGLASAVMPPAELARTIARRAEAAAWK